jgi:acyl dehydratase
MALNLAVVGQKSPALTFEYDWKAPVLYALGVGATDEELDLLYEGRGPKVLPSFAVVPGLQAIGGVFGALGADLTRVLHGEQQIVLHRPIPPSGKLSTVAEVTAIYDKGKSAVALIAARSSDSGGPLFDNVFTIFVRGEGGFGGERGPEAPKADPPDRAPDFEISETTERRQALLYRLSGDLNPLHADPAFAKMAGFERPILHGLCTYGYACRAVLRGAGGGEVARLRSLGARFTGVVMPGDTLTTRGWNGDDGRCLLTTSTQDGRVVLSSAIATLAPAR